MLSIEVVDKSSQPLEEFSMPLSLPLHQSSKSQSSFARSRPQMMLSEEFTKLLPKEEVLSSMRSQFPEPHLSTSRLTFQSESPSVSLKPLELPPQEEPSHNASSIIGISCPETPLMLVPNPTTLSSLSERERVRSQVSQLLITLSTSSEQYVMCFLYQQ